MSTMFRSPSLESLGSCNISLPDFDDASKFSVDDTLDILDDESVLNIDEPLENLGVLEPIAKPSSLILDVFSSEQEVSRYREIKSDIKHHQEPALYGFEKEIPSLMNGALLEEPEECDMVDPRTVHARRTAGASIRREDDDNREDEYAAAAVARFHNLEKKPAVIHNAPSKTQQQPPPTPSPVSQDDAISRIMGYLHYTERDRHLLQRAQEIVQECHQQYQGGKKRKIRNNLSGVIFERLVALMGGPRFQEVFHNSMNFDPSAYNQLAGHQLAGSPHNPYYVALPRPNSGPDTLQVAIAYGMHIARLNRMDLQGNDPEAQLELVQQGVESFQRMSVEERQMFWNYATHQQDL